MDVVLWVACRETTAIKKRKEKKNMLTLILMEHGEEQQKRKRMNASLQDDDESVSPFVVSIGKGVLQILYPWSLAEQSLSPFFIFFLHLFSSSFLLFQIRRTSESSTRVTADPAMN